MTDVIASSHFLNYFDTTADSPILGAIVSTFAGGAVFGALSGGYTMDRFGRRMLVAIILAPDWYYRTDDKFVARSKLGL